MGLEKLWHKSNNKKWINAANDVSADKINNRTETQNIERIR